MSRNYRLYSCYIRDFFVAGVLTACWHLPALAAPTDATSADSESAARSNWRATLTRNPAAAEGCAHASYPNVIWEKMECKVGYPLVRPVRSTQASGAGDVTGDGKDYVAQAAGLITETEGLFPSVTGVTAEKGVGVASFGEGGILGKNEYSRQLNSNYTGTTSVCAGRSGCTVWQQFIYAPDDFTKGEAGVFMQYWLIGRGVQVLSQHFRERRPRRLLQEQRLRNRTRFADYRPRQPDAVGQRGGRR